MSTTRRLTVALANSLVTQYSALVTLENSIRDYGDGEVASAIQRARRELEHPAVTGALNNVGVYSRTIRP